MPSPGLRNEGMTSAEEEGSENVFYALETTILKSVRIRRKIGVFPSLRAYTEKERWDF